MDLDINSVSLAKEYIDYLARGINPVTKEFVDENDTINNVKISRCLFFVSDVLREVMDNGITKKAKKEKLQEFNAEMIDFSKYKYSANPITISVIVEKINNLKPDNMKKLKITAITNWLVDLEILSVVQINDKKQKIPTAKAKRIGIDSEQRNGQYGLYEVVLYNESAQYFIIDNLSSIIEGGYN